MNKYKLNICVSIFFILFGIIVWVAVPYCIRFSDTYSMGNKILTSYFIPRVLVILLILNSAINIVINGLVLKKAKQKGFTMPCYPKFNWRKEYKALIFAMIMLIYALLLDYVGFMVSSILCSFCLLAFMRTKKAVHYVIVVCFIMVIYFVFTNVLYVRLP